MKRILFLLIILLFITPAWADTHTAVSCEYSEVSARVADAGAGDTVTIPAGSCTWASTLAITKPIVLHGNGVGSTVITSTATGGGITYNPASPSSANRFRITGLSLTATTTARAIYFGNTTTTKEFVRLDHCAITVTAAPYAIGTGGTIFGVFDNNTINYYTKGFDFGGNPGSTDAGKTQWEGLDRVYGNEDNLYLEDNTITGGSGALNVSGGGGRFAFRYNTLTPAGFGAFDFHGNQPNNYFEDNYGGNTGSMIGEFYGNDISNITARLNDVRGGKTLHYFNRVRLTNDSSTAILTYREEYSDIFGVQHAIPQKVVDSYAWGNWQKKAASSSLVNQYVMSYLNDVDQENCCSRTITWSPDTKYGTYGYIYYCTKFTNDSTNSCWKLVPGTAGFTSPAITLTSPYHTGETEPNWAGTPARYAIQDGQTAWLNMGTSDTPIVENTDVWLQHTGTFDGTGIVANGGGVGCGTLANRPATCTTGVAYWSTDQSCSDLTGMVGANPSTPISGTLYKCTATNTWEAYYKPYTYPHPLRGTITISGGIAISGGTIQ